MTQFTDGYRISLTNQLNQTSASVQLGFVGLEIITLLGEHLAPVLSKFTGNELSQLEDMHILRAFNVRELTPRQELVNDAKHFFRKEKGPNALIDKIERLNDNEAWLIAAAVLFNEASPQSIVQFTKPDRIALWLALHPEDLGEAMKHIHFTDEEYDKRLESGTYSPESFLQWAKAESTKAREAQRQRQLTRATKPSPIDLLSIRITDGGRRSEVFRVKTP